MRNSAPDPGPAGWGIRIALACLLGWPSGARGAPLASNVAGTKHNLSASGTGSIRAATESRICVFCHTPHNSTPLSPLWNRTLEGQGYTVYASPTLQAGPLAQPTGATKLCLSCHDGTIAMGAVLNPAGGIVMAGSGDFPPGSLSDFGLDLSGHHPVSFSYDAALPNPELAASPPDDLVYGGADEIHCTTCHDPHDDPYGKFLAKDNRFSALCTSCHQMVGWRGSAHATSTVSVVGILPRPPKTWPEWTQLNEWGCETCHTPHFAPTAAGLLNFTDAPPDPFSCTSAGCHSSEPPPPHGPTSSGVVRAPAPGTPAGRGADVARHVRKVSAHRGEPGAIAASFAGAGAGTRAGSRVVGCADCHNPHVTHERKARAPYASGLLEGVSGVDRNGVQLLSSTYEYEVCFKCHADHASDLDHVPRVVDGTNTRLAFDTANPSYHPVLGMGKSNGVPSIPSAFEPAMGRSELIYCTSCHADDEGGSRGPHGSSFRPILRERYEAADGTPESPDAYALCYHCHDRSSILADASFRRKTIRTTASGGGHGGHLAAGAPCSACHDPHGVSAAADAAGRTGSHTHLINFDRRIVLPKPGALVPVFDDTGFYSGSCTLLCHGVDHDHAAYP